MYDNVLDELNATVIFEGKDVFALENQIGFFDVNQDGRKEIVYSSPRGVDYLECCAKSTPRHWWPRSRRKRRPGNSGPDLFLCERETLLGHHGNQVTRQR